MEDNFTTGTENAETPSIDEQLYVQNNVVQNQQNEPGEPKQFTSRTEAEKANKFSVAALVCGIVSLVCCCFGVTFLVGIAGIVLAMIGIRKSPDGKKTMGIIALILSILGTILGIIMIVVWVFYIGLFQNFDFNYYMSLPEGMQEQYMSDYIDGILGS